jgi:hypothetical protein
MKPILFSLAFLLTGCKATLSVQSVNTIEKPTFRERDTIFLSLDYFYHHDFKEKNPDELFLNDDTGYLFKRFISDFDNTARTFFPMNPISVSHNRGCLPLGNLFTTKRPLDTLQLESCLRQKAPATKNSVFVHFIFTRGSSLAGSSNFLPFSNMQFDKYIFYVAGIAENGAFYFRSFRNVSTVYNRIDFSIKEEHKMVKKIVSELQKLYAGEGVK